jgi:hypothetical protein
MKYKMYHFLQLIMWHVLHPLQFDTLKKRKELLKGIQKKLILY